jgi:hypothetical protein
MKSLVGYVMSFVPVIYCFYLVHYFIHECGSLQEAVNNGLGPTIAGLSIVGLLFTIPILVKTFLVIIELRKPRTYRPDGGPPPDGQDDFDADAVVARYLAQRPSQVASGTAAAANGSGEPATGRRSFGRKNK